MRTLDVLDRSSLGLGIPIIDAHAHIWGNASGLKVNDTDVRLLTAMADRFDIEAIVLMPLFGGMCPSQAEISAGNNAAEAVARSDSRFRPMVTVYPRHGSEFCLSQVRRFIERGFHGLKIWVSPADEPCVYPLVEAIIEYGKPILIHAMRKAVGQYPLESEPADVARLARRFPEARIIMAHLGGDFLYGCDAIADHPNVLTDSSGTYCETGMVETAVDKLGAERILFGSDAPGADFVNNLAKVLAADIPAQAQRDILYGNAKALWGWN